MLSSIPLWFYIVVALFALMVVLCMWYIGKIERKLRTFMQGKDATSLENTLSWLTEKYSYIDDTLKAHKEALEHIDRRVKRSVQAHALVHYDAYEDMGGKQSFVSTLLNESGDGYILSVITHRNTTQSYAKKIIAFDPIQSLTTEEKESLTQAKNTL